MKFLLCSTVLAAGIASAASIPSKLDQRASGIPGAALACLAECAPFAEAIPAYAACLAICTAAAEEGKPVNSTDVVSTKRTVLPSE
ncbi:hypothetical protein FP744_10002535 [Trichoderma asperellum]|nr:hypothetical protein LI328DRAFT_124147 [Trichoderma asperelloides]